MRNNIRAMVLAALAASLPFASQAAEAMFTFTGKVTQSAMEGVSTGDLITGTFRYDISTPRDAGNAGNMHASYTIHDPSWSVFTAKVGNHEISASRLSVNVFDNMGGNVEDMVVISGGYQLKVDDTIYNHGSMGLNLSSAPGSTDAVRGIGLPQSYDIARFDAHSSLMYGWAQIDGGPEEQLLYFTPLSISAVPEAGGMALALAGLLTLGAFVRVRQRHR